MVVISYSYHKLDKNWELIGIVGKSCKMLQHSLPTVCNWVHWGPDIPLGRCIPESVWNMVVIWNIRLAQHLLGGMHIQVAIDIR